MDFGSKPDENLCQLCNSAQGKYTCPRCRKRYCSSECYKLKIHAECSEEFYEECVKAELKLKINNLDDRVKMINILKRHKESLNNDVNNKFTDKDTADNDDQEDEDNNSVNLDESFDVLDSDDNDEIPVLAERIKNIDINNPDDIWAALTDTERQEFKAMIYNKETDKLLPKWVPWWLRGVDRKLVTEVVNDSPLDYIKKECPDLIEIYPINGIDKASPLLSHNLVNIVVAYVVMVLHYNGEHQESFRESTEIFLQLNDIIGGDKVFNDDKLAAQAVIKKSVKLDILPENGQTLLVITSVNKIIQGPIDDKIYYLKAVLSDLYVLIEKLNDVLKSNRSTLPKKFQINYSKCCKLTKKHLQLYLKKIQYYLAWVDKFGVRMNKLNFD